MFSHQDQKAKKVSQANKHMNIQEKKTIYKLEKAEM